MQIKKVFIGSLANNSCLTYFTVPRFAFLIGFRITFSKPHGKITRKKKMSKLFSYDGVVKCSRNLNVEKMDVASYTGKMMGFDYCEEYLRKTSNKILLRRVTKSKCSFSCHFQIDKKHQ